MVPVLVGYLDADWPGDDWDRTHVSQYVCFTGAPPVIWVNSKTVCVILSTMSAEFFD